MRRREFVGLIGSAVVWPGAAYAQQAAVRRIAILMPYAEGDPDYEAYIKALRDELRARAWIEGRNIQLDVRWTTDNMDRIRSSAADLVRAEPDVILAIGGRVVPILMRLTKTIPIVVPGASDPVGVGWVQSIARPGGNVTGFTFLELSIFGKLLALLKQADPRVKNVTMIYNSDNPSTNAFRRAFEAAAAELAIEATAASVHGVDDTARVVRGAAQKQDSAILIAPDITLQSLRNEVVALITQSYIPAIYAQAVYVRGGGLMYYGADRVELWHRAAEYVDRIFHGERPGDLPFQQPNKYQLVINLNTAKALGLRLPQSLLATADEVIE